MKMGIFQPASYVDILSLPEGCFFFCGGGGVGWELPNTGRTIDTLVPRKTSFSGHSKEHFVGKFFLRNLKGMTYLHIC